MKSRKMSDLSLLLGGGPAELVEADVEPLVDLCVESVVLVADLTRREPLLHGLGLRGRTVLISTAHVQHVVPA
jgi:hypothetical protein